MRTPADGVLAALQSLLRSAHLSRADDLPAMITEAGEQLGASRSVIYVIDYDQLELVPLTDDSTESSVLPLTVDGTLAGRAFRDLVLHTGGPDPGLTLWVPIVDGTNRLGVLELTFGPDDEVEADEALLTVGRDLAALVAELLLARALYGDAVERARRRRPMTIPAELQWQLLPPLTFVSPQVAVTGVLAPTTDVAGDSFDYAVNGDVAHVAIVDAMGHGLEATLLSTVAIGALRNARRGGESLVDTVRIIEASIATHFGPDKFVTAIVGELDTRSGMWTWVSCGHPPALVLRSGRVVKTLDATVGMPLGLGLLARDPEIATERLEPGDRLLLYTDGVVEARDADGEFFGTERLVEFVIREAAAGRPAAETMRRVNLAILEHQEGALQDDATTVMVEWLTDEAARSTP
ncbi:MAG: serine/threonine-protein phosphatase [Actinomycetota bacterium]|nr:serine/threonine-protein phosphatase [Actinomycetota bacterium]